MAEKITITDRSTIPQALKDRIQLHPHQLAQIDGDNRMTYREMGEQIDKLASGLLDLGIQPGEKVALVLPAGNTFPVAMYAIIQIGAVSVGINPILKPHEFRHIFSDSEAAAVIVADRFHGADPLGILREMREALPNLRHLIVDGEAGAGEINLQELIGKAEPREIYHQAHPDELTALIYTSGTTGLPKGSMHSHATMLYPLKHRALKPPQLSDFINIIRRYGFNYAWRAIKSSRKPLKIYYSMPPYTGAGTMGVIGLFLSSYVMVHLDRFTPTDVLRLIEKEQIAGIGLPPALGLMLVRSPNLNEYNLSSLLYVGLVAAPVPSLLIDEFWQKVRCPVLNGFGATELFGGPTSLNPFSDPVAKLRETVGKVRPDYEVKIVDEKRKPVPAGIVGELAVRSGIRMLGYYKADDLTQNTFDEQGWYYTGDQAILDEEGYVRIVGRIKDMIIRGGQNIYPAELESVLLKHPEIRDAAVIGIPDALAGEKVLAYIIPNGKNGLTPVDVLNFCRENMAAYKVPARVYFVDSFPLNATGKVLKRVLQEEAMEAS